MKKSKSIKHLRPKTHKLLQIIKVARKWLPQVINIVVNYSSKIYEKMNVIMNNSGFK